jgi:DNA-binding response OmpR family regulator
MANNPKERILVVENDSFLRDQIAHHILESNGYQVQAAADAVVAIATAVQWVPDLIMLNLDLPGLSGKDLLVALSSQGVNTPLVVLAAKGMEGDVIQAFRLGAVDYLSIPAREAEVISVVERVTRQVRERHERERLAIELRQSNQLLQTRIQEQNVLFAVGKAVTSITDQSLLFDRLLDSAVRLTHAELGYLLLREDVNQPFFLAAHRGLPPSLAQYINQPWDDGVSSLVAMSGESLSIHGEALRRFKISSLGESAQISPVKVQKQVIGLLCVMRKKAQAFSENDKNLLEALGDYASISIVNARLFRTIEQRAQALQVIVDKSQRSTGEKILQLKDEMATWLESTHVALERLVKAPGGHLSDAQKKEITILRNQFQQFSHMLEGLSNPMASVDLSRPPTTPVKR